MKILLLIVLLFAPFYASAQCMCETTFYGHVQNTEGAPISRAIVSVTGSSGQPQNATTNVFGNFQMTLSVGSYYLVQINARRHQPYQELFVLYDNSRVFILEYDKSERNNRLSKIESRNGRVDSLLSIGSRQESFYGF